MRIIEEALSFCLIPQIGKEQVHLRHPVKNKVRKRRGVPVVWRAHLNTQADALIVLLRQIENELQIVRNFQTTALRLHLSPRGANIELLAQWKQNQIFNS